MPTVKPQPLLSVRDVKTASSWYQQVFGLTSGHGGPEYEQLFAATEMVLQLHSVDEAHHHGALAKPNVLFGNGVAVWFEVSPLDEIVSRAREARATIVTDVHVNPNAGHRELWLRDPDGYLVVAAGV